MASLMSLYQQGHSIQQERKTVKNQDTLPSAFTCLSSGCCLDVPLQDYWEGDWRCVKCGDHQFARNRECRPAPWAFPSSAQDTQGSAGSVGSHPPSFCQELRRRPSILVFCLEEPRSELSSISTPSVRGFAVKTSPEPPLDFSPQAKHQTPATRQVSAG